ncbi:hypothetical protein [Leptospirillum ferriphilum]|uniref:hypothetical protein n=1 Tax=Leptospirillum ferriphilum TaxID=178606 RepID=UPI0006B1DD9D|nr:hypothetical protein [Leptospirillum ferriphilum]
MTDQSHSQKLGLNPELCDLSKTDLVERITGHRMTFDITWSFQNWIEQIGPQGTLAMIAAIELARREKEAGHG